MSRATLAKSISSMPWEVLQNEPDVFQLVQSYWDKGNELFHLFFEEKRSEAYKALVFGPWTDEDLFHFKQDMEQMAEIISAYNLAQDT
jgi:hypothetical protein